MAKGAKKSARAKKSAARRAPRKRTAAEKKPMPVSRAKAGALKPAASTPASAPPARAEGPPLPTTPPPSKPLPRAPERTRFGVSSEGERKALVIVDLQSDFCPGGALPVPRGDEVVGPTNALVDKARAAGDRIYATREWLPQGSRHFKEQGGPWPEHCLEGSKGAEFQAGLKLPWDATIISKGMDGAEDTYSGFLGKTPDGRSLLPELRLRGVSHLVVCGLATDYCVKATVLDALKNGFKVTVIKDAIRAVDVRPGDGEAAIAEMKKAGAKVA